MKVKLEKLKLSRAKRIGLSEEEIKLIEEEPGRVFEIKLSKPEKTNNLINIELSFRRCERLGVFRK